MKKQSRMMQGEQNRKTFVWMWESIAGKRYYIVFLLIISVLLGMSGGLLALLLRNLIDHAVEGERSGFVTVIWKKKHGQLMKISGRNDCFRNLWEEVTAKSHRSIPENG